MQPKGSHGTDVYYFSGTGNSFAVARYIAGKIGGELVLIKLKSQRVKMYGQFR